MIEDPKLPKRPRSHVIADRALDVFNYHRRPEWAVNESRRDYGWDIIVTIEEKEYVGEDFLVQLKGSDSPPYIENFSKISYPLEIRTINWLLSKPMPSMLCVCDTGKQAEPLYWIWLQDAIAGIEKGNVAWMEQDTVNLHIPLTNLLNQDAWKKIEDHVKEFLAENGIKNRIGELIFPSLRVGPSDNLPSYRDDPSSFLSHAVTPLRDAGVVDLIKDEEGLKIEAFSPEDQARYRKIKEISNLLNALREKDAEELIREVADEIQESSSSSIKAMYSNNMGALFVYKRDLESAIASFSYAHSLNAQEPKYAVNLLQTEYLRASSSESYSDTIPSDWLDRLETILTEKPEHCPAVRLKSSWLGDMKGPHIAEDFLRCSSCWQRETLECICYLAETYKYAGQLTEAERLLEEAQSLGLELDAQYWSLYGAVLFKKAFGMSGSEAQFLIEGPGPSSLHLPSLRKSCDCFRKAFIEFQSRGFPTMSESTVSSYMHGLRVLGSHDIAEEIGTAYLMQHPDNANIHEALSLCLVFQDKIFPALKHARIAHEADPLSSTRFKNFILCLFEAEEFDQLLDHVSNREQKRFRNKDEEGLAVSLAAISYSELGMNEKAEELLDRLRTDSELAKEAINVKASIVRYSHASKEQIASIYRSGLQEFPGDVRLLSHFVNTLSPVTRQNAEEIANCIKLIADQRQLLPPEFHLLGHSYIYLEKPELAEKVFESALNRYPNEPSFIYARARARLELGDEEGSFQLLVEYIDKGKRDYSVLSNTAFLAFETGRLNEAIKLFELALRKTKEESEKGPIHCQLYELRKRRGDPPKEILRHVVEFGKTIEDSENEAAYLMMFMLAPEEKEPDQEVKKWIEEFRERLSRFSEAHPRFHSFMTFKIPDGLSEEEKASYILSDAIAVTLPQRLASTPFRLSARGIQWPLAFRAEKFFDVHSVFQYWSICTNSSDFENGIHLFYYQFNNMPEETETAKDSDRVCLDLTALLTLAELDMLSVLSRRFRQIILARGTKTALQKEYYGEITHHPLAQRIEEWRIANRAMIRVRNYPRLEESNQPDAYMKTIRGIFMRREERVDTLVGEGIGESLLLAKMLRVPLYSDESLIRKWAHEEFATSSFSTLGFLRCLRDSGQLTAGDEAAIYAKLIQKNFRLIPFTQDHLNSQLHLILQNARSQRKRITTHDLQSHSVLGTLIRQFGDSDIKEELRIHLATDWWLSVLSDTRFDFDVLVECMIYPTFCFSLASKASVLNRRIIRNEDQDRAAHVWAFFLWRTYLKHEQYTEHAWSSIKHCAKEMFSEDEGKLNRILFAFIPKWLISEAKADTSIEYHKKLDYIIDIPLHFQQEDRLQFETYLTKEIRVLK